MKKTITKGIGGHQSANMRTDEWVTPPKIKDALGEFDLDPCSPINRPWPTAKHHFTIFDDGLKKEWFGRVWLNPPYGSQVGRWMNKLSFHGNGIALIFARTETKFFFKYVWDLADSILFIKDRLFFHTVEGERARHNAGAPSVLIAYGDQNTQSLSESGIAGKFLYINVQPIVIVGISPKWISVVTMAINQTGEDQLKPIYDLVERIAPDKVAKNQHWKAKVRQTVQIIRKRKNITLSI